MVAATRARPLNQQVPHPRILRDGLGPLELHASVIVLPQLHRQIALERLSASGDVTTASACQLLWTAQPGVLPTYGDVLEVASILDVGAVAVADLYRLMFAYGKRHGAAEARTSQR